MKVPEYFRNFCQPLIIMKAVEKQILPLIKEILNVIPTIDTIVTTGHSLGGALAVLCAFDLSLKFKDDATLGNIKINGDKKLKDSVSIYSHAVERDS